MDLDIKAICSSAIEKRYTDNSSERALIENLLYEHVYTMSRRLKNKLSSKVGYSIVEQEVSTKTLVQEIYVKIFSNTRTLQESEKDIVLNITNITRTVIFDLARYINTQREQNNRSAENIEDAENSGAFELSVADNVMMVMLQGAIDKLEQKKPDAYEVFSLKQFGGFSEIEISELLEMSRHQVRKYIATSKAFIKQASELH